MTLSLVTPCFLNYVSLSPGTLKVLAPIRNYLTYSTITTSIPMTRLKSMHDPPWTCCAVACASICCHLLTPCTGWDSLMLAYLAASTLNAPAALSLAKLTIKWLRTLQVGNKKAGVDAGQDANKRAETMIVVILYTIEWGRSILIPVVWYWYNVNSVLTRYTCVTYLYITCIVHSVHRCPQHTPFCNLVRS